MAFIQWINPMEKVYYTVELPFNSLKYNGWIEYRGEDIGYDWWNCSPIRFSSAEEAILCIKASKDYSHSKWRIIKNTITREVAA